MAIKIYSFLFLCLVLTWKICEGEEKKNLLKYISEDLEPCYRDDPKLNACLKRESNKVLKKFSKGIPEFGIPPTDPLVLDDTNIISQSDILQMKMLNPVMYGLGDNYVEEFFIDIEKMTGYMHIRGNASMNAIVDTKGRLLVIPINISGNMTTTFINFSMKLNWNWGLKKKKNIEYCQTHNITSKLTYDDVKVDTYTFIDRNNLLGQALQRVLEDNRRLFIDELGAPVQNKVVKQTVKIMNKLFNAVPYDILLPVHK